MVRKGATMVTFECDPELKAAWDERAREVGRNKGLMLQRAMRWYLRMPPDYPPVDELLSGTVPEAPNDAPQPAKGRPTKPNKLPERLQVAVDWLRQQLENGPVMLRMIREGAEAVGINARLLYRARDTLQVHEYTAKGKWWQLPEKKYSE